MSAELIIILIGALCLLVVIFDSIRARNSASSPLINPKLRAPLGIIGVSLLMYAGYSDNAVTPPAQMERVEVASKKQVVYPVEKVQITSPVAGDSVVCRILTMGVYPEGHDKDIWVLLKPSDGKYYPQSDHTNTSFKRNGEWQVITRFGGDKGEDFDIIVYETDASASEFFSATIEAWKGVEKYPGLESTELPGGANEVDRIVVSLKENCRGVF